MGAEELFDRLTGMVRDELDSAPGCHDFDHTMRVLENARILCGQENPSDPVAVELAALLHDIARPEELASGGKLCHARLGAEKSAEFLRKSGCVDEALIGKVSLCVRRHRYRGDERAETHEERIVYDADKLDSIGAVGIGRAFHFAGRIGARLHNTEQEALASKAYSREDSAYREYLVKLRHVPERMLTESGRHLAVSRAGFMKLFFETFQAESSGDGNGSRIAKPQ